jgi:outer membrane protein assembly factor BamB
MRLINVMFLTFCVAIALASCSFFGYEGPGTPPLSVYPKPDSTARGDNLREIWSVPRLGIYYDFSECRALPFGNNVILGHDTVVECRSQSDGHLVWAYGGKQFKIWFSDEMILDNGRLYVDMADQELVCLDPTTGHAFWDITIPGVLKFWECFNGSCQSPDAIFLSLSLDYMVVAISKSTGAILWESDDVLPKGYDWTGNWGGYRSELTAPCYLDGAVYVGAELTPSTLTPDGCLTKLDASSGKILWTKYLPAPDSTTGFANYKDPEFNNTMMTNGILAYGHDLIITPGYCIGLIDSSGNFIWRKAPSVDGSIEIYDQLPHLINGRLYAYNNGTGSGAFASSIDPNTGQVFWSAKVTKSGETHTIESENMACDSSNIYHVTDDEEMVGQSMLDGRETLFCNMQYYYYSPLMNDSKYMGCLQFVGNRFFGVGDDSIYCYQIGK